MRRSFFLVPLLLLTAAPVVGQSSSDSQTPQALLAEVRQLRHDLQTTTIAAQRAQILLFRVQRQQGAVDIASQKLDDARARLTETQSNRTRLVNDIRQNEDFATRNENSLADRKSAEDTLAALKAALSQLQAEEQQRQTKETEAEEALRIERAKLAELQEQMDRLDRILEKSSQQLGSNH